MGLAFTRTYSGTLQGGIYIILLLANGETALSSNSYANSIRTDCTWRLMQQSIDNTEDPPLFGVCSTEKNSIYRITSVATKIYTNTSLNFYDYPIDTGRYHVILVLPGRCEETIAAANYAYARAVYVNLETLTVDFCHLEVPMATSSSDTEACGNGVLDYTEACDDGNKRNGDGCSSTCVVEPGWRCFSSPFATKCKELLRGLSAM